MPSDTKAPPPDDIIVSTAVVFDKDGYVATRVICNARDREVSVESQSDPYCSPSFFSARECREVAEALLEAAAWLEGLAE